MGILSSLRRSSTARTDERRASIAAFEQAQFEDRLAVDGIDEKQRTAIESERTGFERMTDKEKVRWIEFKERGTFGKDEGAAGTYAGGKCC